MAGEAAASEIDLDRRAFRWTGFAPNIEREAAVTFVGGGKSCRQ